MRGYKSRLYYKELLYELLRNNKAIEIQSINIYVIMLFIIFIIEFLKGITCRYYLKLLKKITFENEVIIPCAVIIQSLARGFIYRRRVKKMKIEMNSVKKIQRFWKNQMKKRNEEERTKLIIFERNSKAAIKIECCYRKWKAIELVELLRKYIYI